MLNRVVTVAALAVGGKMLSNQLKKNKGYGASSSIVETIEVNVPVRTAPKASPMASIAPSGS